MPHSADNDGVRLAIAAECCYLANLTVLPLLGFFVLLAVYFARIDTASALARCHLRQALVGSLWAGVLLILLNALILLMGGYRSHLTIVTLILYFFSVHSMLIILGMAGLAKAFAGQKFIYPLIGARCDD